MARNPKVPAPKAPPGTWYRGIIRNPIAGMRVGTQVAFRRSREGGWRVLSSTRQVLLADMVVPQYVIALRHHGKPIPLPDQEAANVRLADIFHGRVLIGVKVGDGPYTQPRLGVS